MSDFKDILAMSQQLMSRFSDKVELCKEVERMYFMEDDEIAAIAQRMDNGKLTLSPDARNSLLGAVRLMIAADPQFSVPRDENEELGDDTLDDIENFASQMWNAAGRLYGAPLHYDAVMSGLLYGEVHIAVKRMKLLAAHANKKGGARAARIEKASRRTPYSFEIWNPKNCFYEMDQFGLIYHFRRVETTASRILSDYGDKVLPARYNNNLNAAIVLCEWWDLDDHVIWIEGEKKPIEEGPHGLDFIPIVVQISEGSWGLFPEGKRKATPFLYGVAKSGIWKRQNMLLTSILTNVHNFAINPMFVYKANTAGKTLNVDWSRPGGVATIEEGEELSAMANKGLIDPSVLETMNIIDGLTTESTLYKQVLGEPLGKNAPYSMVALLSQSGRLPLISPQKRIGWAIAKAIELALEWERSSPEGPARVKFGQQVTELDPSTIPDDLEIECALEITLPQDDLQNANIANAVTQGDNPLASLAWARENILKIGQSTDMQREIWGEKVAAMFAEDYVTRMWQAIEQLRLATTQAGMQGGPPQPGQAQGPPPPGQGGPGMEQGPNIPLTPGQPPNTAGLPPPRQPQQY